MARIIALANQKGGVGKTTSTINLGAALAERGRRVLLVDVDPQASLTDALGIVAGATMRVPTCCKIAANASRPASTS